MQVRDYFNHDHLYRLQYMSDGTIISLAMKGVRQCHAAVATASEGSN